MMTGNRLHAARVLTGLSRQALAQQAHVAPGVLAALESAGPGPLAEGDPALARLMAALETAGVVFGADGDIRLPAVPDDAGLRPEDLNAFNDG